MSGREVGERWPEIHIPNPDDHASSFAHEFNDFKDKTIAQLKEHDTQFLKIYLYFIVMILLMLFFKYS